jgi:photosystem II stability/assembly factor-like uncharacterized protein
VKLALRAGLVAVVAAVAAQTGAAASPARMRLVTAPESFLLWNQHDGLLGVGRCDVANDIHEGLCVSGAIERTNDGGRTYHVVLRTRRAVGYLQSVGPRGAIATTIGNDTWLTLDRGRTWRHLSRRPTVDWLTSQIGVSFRSYSVGDRGELALRVTRDGGRTWRRQHDPCEQAIAFDAFADLVTPKLWWLACLGQPGAGNEDKAVYRTRDGGRTWQAGAATILIAPPGTREHGGIEEYGYPAQLAFAADGFGLLTETRGTLYVTRDGGVHFRAEPKVARPEIDFAGGAAVFGRGIGYVLLTHSFRARLIETRDFGRTWHVVRRWRNG